jgi:hypothetical protein
MFAATFSLLSKLSRPKSGGRMRHGRSLRFQELEPREVPAAYVWTGLSDPQNWKWSDPTNWKIDGQPGLPGDPAPGAGDDVTLDGTPDPNLRTSVVDRLFTVNTLTITGGYNNTVMLEGDLDVMGGGPSSIASGKIQEIWHDSKIQFMSDDYADVT